MNPPDILTDPGASTHLNTSGEKAFVCIANRVTEIGMFAGTKSPIATDMIQVAGFVFSEPSSWPWDQGQTELRFVYFPLFPGVSTFFHLPLLFSKGQSSSWGV